MKFQNTLRIKRKNLTCGLAIALTTLLVAVASPAQTSVFTVGLNNPAKINVAGGASLLVSEAGTTAPNSGRISLVNRTTGARQTLIDGLPSAVNNDGGAPETSGPAGFKTERAKTLCNHRGGQYGNAGHGRFYRQSRAVLAVVRFDFGIDSAR